MHIIICLYNSILHLILYFIIPLFHCSFLYNILFQMTKDIFLSVSNNPVRLLRAPQVVPRGIAFIVYLYQKLRNVKLPFGNTLGGRNSGRTDRRKPNSGRTTSSRILPAGYPANQSDYAESGERSTYVIGAGT